MTTDTNEKVRENRLRRMAKRQGLMLQRSRRRDPRAVDYGRYILADARINGIVFGSGPNGFDATLDDIEDYLTRD